MFSNEVCGRRPRNSRDVWMDVPGIRAGTDNPGVQSFCTLCKLTQINNLLQEVPYVSVLLWLLDGTDAEPLGRLAVGDPAPMF